VNSPNKKQDIKVPSLRDLATFPIGSSVRYKPFHSDSKLQELQQHHFSSYTSGQDMKMHRIMPSKGQFDFRTVDKIVAYTRQNDQRLFGHNLIWHSSTPAWVKDHAKDNPEWLSSFMREYIHSYVGRYKGYVHGWDVVNEGLNTAGEGFRENSIWFQTLGEKYIEMAFQFAHEADPEAVLFYNDFNIERDIQKFESMMAMVKDFQNRGVPISGIGFQMHIRMDIPNQIITETLKQAADTGLQIHLSEVDVIFNSHDDSKGGGEETYKVLTPKMADMQKQKYSELIAIYQTVVPKEQQYGITFWGFNDRDTWIKRFFRMNDWPTIYDEELKPKPAFWGVLEALK
jgi:endo-1,4-beta-xylanase